MNLAERRCLMKRIAVSSGGWKLATVAPRALTYQLLAIQLVHFSAPCGSFERRGCSSVGDRSEGIFSSRRPAFPERHDPDGVMAWTKHPSSRRALHPYFLLSHSQLLKPARESRLNPSEGISRVWLLLVDLLVESWTQGQTANCATLRWRVPFGFTDASTASSG